MPTIKDILADLARLGAKQVSTQEIHTRREGFTVVGKAPIPDLWGTKRFFPQTVRVTLTSPRLHGAWSITSVEVTGPVQLADGTPGQKWSNSRTFHPDETDWPEWVQALANASLELARWEARVTATETEDTDGERG